MSKDIFNKGDNMLTELWMSDLLKSVLLGRRTFLFDEEKMVIEREMLDWEYRIRNRSIHEQIMISESERTRIEFWLRACRINDERSLDEGNLKYFKLGE